MKKVLSFFINPPFSFLISFWILTFVSVVLSILCINNVESMISYFVYFIAGVSLFYTVYTLVKYGKNIKNRVMEELNNHNFTKKLIKDYSFRTFTFSTLSLIINIVFAVFNGVIGFLTNSVWFVSMSLYYILLVIIRYKIFMGNKKSINSNEKDLIKIKTLKATGVFLICLVLILTVSVAQMVLSRKPIIRYEVIAIMFAVYTFYKIILSIYNVIKAHKKKDPIIQAFRNINLTDALTTLISLQVTLISIFGTDEGSMIFNALTGFVVCAFIIFLGIYTVIKSNKMIKELIQNG